MNYSEACEILNLTTPKSLIANARMAESMLNRMTDNAPLRFKVAAQTIIDAAREAS